MTKQPKQTVKINVARLLTVFPEARQNDKLLTALYWEHIDGIQGDDFVNAYVARGTTPETITRSRRILQEDGLYLPPEEFQANRAERAETIRQTINTTREI